MQGLVCCCASCAGEPAGNGTDRNKCGTLRRQIAAPCAAILTCLCHPMKASSASGLLVIHACCDTHTHAPMHARSYLGWCGSPCMSCQGR
eukprot:361791-Chlamydomonas_euryale.AAC.14